MNEKVIEEIANQLGIAVDQASQFLGDMIPQYAGLQALNMAGGAFVALGFLVGGLIAVKIGIPMYKNRKDRCDDRYWSPLGFGGAAAISAFTCLVIILCNIAGWVMFPEAKVMEMVLDKI